MRTRIARPVARNAETGAPEAKNPTKSLAVASRKSDPVIAAVERKETIRESPDLTKKHGLMPTPFVSFSF